MKRHTNRESLFFRYCTGAASTEEKVLVEEMMATDATVAPELENLRQAVAIQQQIHQMEAINANAAYAYVHHTIQKSARRKKLTSGLYRAAAILLLPLLISSLTFGYLALRKDRTDAGFAEFAAPPGVVARFELPDKSQVWLNSNSKLRYPIRFDKRAREVQLEGEGFFEVQSDKKHPFYVTTASGLKVMAHGTQFNVDVDPTNTEIILAEGNVALLHHDTVLKEMRPQEAALFDNETGRLEMRNVNLSDKLAWRDGKLIFRDVPLEQIFDQLSRRYHVEIVIHDEHRLLEKYTSCRVTFAYGTIEQMLSYLKIAAPIEWTITQPKQSDEKQRIDIWIKKE